MIGFYLRVPGRPMLGALNLFAKDVHAFDGRSIHVGELFAAHATVVVAAQKHAENLQAAVDTRDVIGMAKGVLMQRHQVGDQRAFDMLLAASNRSNIKLRDVARWIVEDIDAQAVSHPESPSAGHRGR